MKVILSWSGERSRAVAEALRGWLQQVVHAAEPWMSEHDIDKGSFWTEAIMAELTAASYGVICITPENQHREWISFEAGAIATKFGPKRACPLLFKMEKGQLTGPLSLLQATELEKEDFKKLVKGMNAFAKSKGEAGLDDAGLETSFETFWPQLEAKLAKVPAQRESAPKKRPTDEMVEELLLIARSLMAQGVSLSEDERGRVQEMILSRGIFGGPVDIPGAFVELPDVGLEKPRRKSSSLARMEIFARMIAAGAPSLYKCPKCGSLMKLGLIPGSQQAVYICESCGDLKSITPQTLESNNPSVDGIEPPAEAGGSKKK